MKDHFILGIHSPNRLTQSASIQQLLTEFGCSIRTRIGLHEVQDGVCARDGVILLELVGEPAHCEELSEKLSKIRGVQVQKMIFTHEN
ncbi:MAG: hypothetical protein E7028_07130 [Planctomycetaceae bacterium]|nr:hypothetical protein [Planctomycetaceae bacterium]